MEIWLNFERLPAGECRETEGKYLWVGKVSFEPTDNLAKYGLETVSDNKKGRVGEKLWRNLTYFLSRKCVH